MKIQNNFTGFQDGFVESILDLSLEDLEKTIEPRVKEFEEGTYFVIDPSIPSEELGGRNLERYRSSGCVFVKVDEPRYQDFFKENPLQMCAKVIHSSDDWLMSDNVAIAEFQVVEIDADDILRQNIGARFILEEESKWGVVLDVADEGFLKVALMERGTNKFLGTAQYGLDSLQVTSLMFPLNSNDALPFRGRETFKMKKSYAEENGFDKDTIFIAKYTDFCEEKNNIVIYFDLDGKEFSIPLSDILCSVTVDSDIADEIPDMDAFPNLAKKRV